MRRPEPNQDVKWQRHLPAGAGADQTQRLIMIHELAAKVEVALLRHVDDFADGDLVVTISKRPFEESREGWSFIDPQRGWHYIRDNASVCRKYVEWNGAKLVADEPLAACIECRRVLQAEGD